MFEWSSEHERAELCRGIDLGTTHCALAASPVSRAAVKLYDLPQLVAPGEVADQPLLPSPLSAN